MPAYLGGPWLDGGDAGRVDEGLGPARRLLDQALPLPGQPCELLLVLVEARVHTVLEVGRCRDLYPLLLLPKHGAEALSTRRAQTWAPMAGLWEGAAHQNPPVSSRSSSPALVLSILVPSLVPVPIPSTVCPSYVARGTP